MLGAAMRASKWGCRAVGGKRYSSLRRARGFTLLELMIALAVLAILTVVAYPSMRDLIRRERATTQSNSMMADLQFARGEAVATQGYVSVCPVATAGTQSCATKSGSYDQGWLVFATTSPNTQFDGTNANLLKAEDALNMVSMRSDVSGVLSFNQRGELLVAGAPASVTIATCAKSSRDDSIGTSTQTVPGFQLTVSDSGRVASSQLAAASSCD
jgi:type IV fimbrial biogenesis protein FimT